MYRKYTLNVLNYNDLSMFFITQILLLILHFVDYLKFKNKFE